MKMMRCFPAIVSLVALTAISCCGPAFAVDSTISSDQTQTPPILDPIASAANISDVQATAVSTQQAVGAGDDFTKGDAPSSDSQGSVEEFAQRLMKILEIVDLCRSTIDDQPQPF